jgi:hypothetical protein
MKKFLLIIIGLFVLSFSANASGNGELSQKALESIGKFLVLDFKSNNGKYKPLTKVFLVKKTNNIKIISENDENLHGVKGFLPKGEYQEIRIINEISEIGMVVRYAYLFNDTKVFWSDSSNSLLKFQLRPELGNTGVLPLMHHRLSSISEFLQGCQKGEIPMDWEPLKGELDFYSNSINSFWKVFVNRVGHY